jgi:hypothetical protein
VCIRGNTEKFIECLQVPPPPKRKHWVITQRQYIFTKLYDVTLQRTVILMITNVISTKSHTFDIPFQLHFPYEQNLLIPWSRFLLEKLTGSQLVKKFPAFYVTRKFITAFTTARSLNKQNRVRNFIVVVQVNLALCTIRCPTQE